jgi:hypothetical protein
LVLRNLLFIVLQINTIIAAEMKNIYIALEFAIRAYQSFIFSKICLYPVKSTNKVAGFFCTDFSPESSGCGGIQGTNNLANPKR